MKIQQWHMELFLLLLFLFIVLLLRGLGLYNPVYVSVQTCGTIIQVSQVSEYEYNQAYKELQQNPFGKFTNQTNKFNFTYATIQP